MKLIVGLGNPGKKYAKNRHNVGFMVVDALVQHFGWADFKEVSKFKALVTTGEISGERVMVLKPMTYMNLSGESVSSLVQFYKISSENILVCYDDLDLPLGKIRFREKGSAGTHNGMKSVIENLGSQNFPRFRVGIESRGVSVSKKADTTDFVLGNFRTEEKKIIHRAIGKVVELLIKALGARH